MLAANPLNEGIFACQRNALIPYGMCLLPNVKSDKSNSKNPVKVNINF
jgi:hypothetical protein